jgi:hypothetical protein
MFSIAHKIELIMASEVYDLYIRILTPVHVGVDKSKDLTAGLDFKVENGRLSVFDHKKLIEMVSDMNQYCTALENGTNGMNQLLRDRKIQLDYITAMEYPISGDPSELSRQIRNGLNGLALLPGSSIKGALTSVLFNHFFQESNDGVDAVMNRRDHRGRVKPPQNHYLGTFQNSLNRYIHCTDVSFEKLSAYNAKIFNLTGLNGNFLGGWKHNLDNQTNQEFNSQGFTFAFETIDMNQSAPFVLRFDKNMYQKYISEASRKDQLHQLPRPAQGFNSEGNFRTKLFNILFTYSSVYLTREIDFLEKFSQAQYSDQLISALENLKNQNTQEAPIFRLASGSGFHCITGDWQFNTHDINNVLRVTNRRGELLHHRGKFNKFNSAKSRRFAFDQDDQSNYRFYPMGFVQLMTRQYYEDHFLAEEMARKEREEHEMKKREEDERLRKKAEEKAIKEAQKPKWTDPAQLRTGFRTIDAEVVGQEGLSIILKPFVTGFDTVIRARYPSGMDNGTIVTIEVNLAGRTLQVKGAPRKK